MTIQNLKLLKPSGSINAELIKTAIEENLSCLEWAEGYPALLEARFAETPELSAEKQKHY